MFFSFFFLMNKLFDYNFYFDMLSFSLKMRIRTRLVPDERTLSAGMKIEQRKFEKSFACIGFARFLTYAYNKRYEDLVGMRVLAKYPRMPNTMS